MIDRRKVRKAFHRGAADYDAYAAVQKRVMERILSLLFAEGVEPARILDVGAGTGALALRLADRYPSAAITCVDLAHGMAQQARDNLGRTMERLVAVADAEHLPLRDGVFDLVVSTSTFQWLTTLDRAFAEARRVLADDGLFAFALFGDGTFRELKASYRTALQSVPRGGRDRTHRFFTRDEVRAALARAGFRSVEVFDEDEVEYHPDVPAFLRSVKRIGAGNASPVAGRGLSGRRVMETMMRTYAERFGGTDGIPATYTVVYGVGKR
ncbi:malonyl-ACP O-methyltransferase BioC [Geobacter sulfurreducens]|uniref:malonyl-ACP O-methyltransferase BioC n=1 Tax=Geobacter sulfurreducens TaxID=35554 RepID=UPI000DBB0918|nr:malonyl-ACP O-methyltransferase BioC [Geobacter sulfurreducens]BBA71062.1 Malonyl-[acyl-carrier protein] O-methyltransferase [Geobacter sulfurreducens]